MRSVPLLVAAILLLSGWNATPVASVQSVPFRLDDQLSSATVKASSAASAGTSAAPVVWQDFLTGKDLTWTLLRGRMGYRNGDMMIKADGSTPVILAPKEPAIDWSLYEGVEVRMSVGAGSEAKIRIGDYEVKQKLGAPGQYQVYRFDVNLDAPKGSRPLAIMPTDSLTDIVAIRSIKLLPRAESFPLPAGRKVVAKQDEYRSTLYAHAPATLSFPVTPPRNGRLRFGMSVAAKGAPVTFRVQVQGAKGDLFSRTLSNNDDWVNGDVDLTPYGERRISLSLVTESERAGAVGLWANPLITTGAAARRPNVLIYMIDTLRADHSSLYGYSRETTPYLKQLGRTGVVFDDCQAQATWTKASTASLMTSLYSFTHGIVNDFDTIPSGAATLAEQLRAAGYSTTSIVANPYAGRATGLQRGFDYLLEFPIVLRKRTEAADRATDSAAVNKLAFEWLDAHRDEPFFLYAHSTDPHAPYRPPPPYDSTFANPAETAEFDRNYAKLRTERDYGGATVVSREGATRAGLDPDRFIKQAVDRYDGEILHNDKSFELLIGKLRQLGVLDNTLVIVLSDHGEEFWDHGWTAHGHSLYQELAHTVFLMWNPKMFPAARRISEPVQLIDVMPTVLDILGLKQPPIVQGQSLAELARGRAFQRHGIVMSSRFSHPAAQPNGPVKENQTNSFALLDAKWKLIYRDRAKEVGINRVELYDRVADRTERRNVSSQNAGEVERRMTEVGKWIDAQKQLRQVLGRGAGSTLDQKTIEHLRSLGYLGGTRQ